MAIQLYLGELEHAEMDREAGFKRTFQLCVEKKCDLPTTVKHSLRTLSKEKKELK